MMDNMQIEFSPGQLEIIKDIAHIYNNNLQGSLDQFYSGSSPINTFLSEISNDLEHDQSDINRSFEENLHQDFFKHHDLKSQPERLFNLTVMDLVILKFIAKEFSEDYSWNDLELANLIIKLDLLIQNKNDYVTQ